MSRLFRIGVVLAIAAAPCAAMADYSQSRANECAAGDVQVQRTIAYKMAESAIERFKIQDLVTQADIKRAEGEIYHYLSWTLGNPTAVCAQYITGGRTHFHKAYGDEAAAALLGSELPGNGKADFTFPPAFVELIKKEANGQISKYLQEEYGFPPELADLIDKEFNEAMGKQLSKLGFSMPKKFDVSNKLIEGFIESRRHPASSAGTQPLTPTQLRPGLKPAVKPGGGRRK